MVKLEIQFASNEIDEIRLVDDTNFAEWSILLLPLRQIITIDFEWMYQESVARMKNFDCTQLTWHKNLVPYIIVDSVSSSPQPTDTKHAPYEHKLNVLDGSNHVCIYDIYQHRLRVLPSKMSLAVQQMKFTRYLSIIYHKMCVYLRTEHMGRSALEGQRTILQGQKQITETLDELVARKLSSSPHIRSTRLPSSSTCMSPTIRRPQNSRVNIWKIPNDDNKDEKDLWSPPISSCVSSSRVLTGRLPRGGILTLPPLSNAATVTVTHSDV